MDYSELLIGIAEIAVALAGFTGVVVVFGSRKDGTWHPGDRLRLGFLLEASLTAGGFSLLSLILFHSLKSAGAAWVVTGVIWAAFMAYSLYSSRRQIQIDQDAHGDVDRIANKIVSLIFVSLIVLQIANIFMWQEFAPLLAALTFNIAGAAMQFARLIRSAFV